MPDDDDPRHSGSDDTQRTASEKRRDVDQGRAVQHVELIANLAASFLRSKRKRD